MPRSKKNSIEAFRALVSAAFPENARLAEIELPDSMSLAWRKLVSLSGVSLPEFIHTVAHQAGIDAADSLKSEPEALAFFPVEKIREQGFLPLFLQEGVLHVAIPNPTDSDLLDAVYFHVQGSVRFLLAAPDAIEEGIFAAFSASEEGSVLAKGKISLDFEGLEGDVDNFNEETERVSKHAKALLRKAIELGASDLHLQPFLGGGVARVRVDGMLRRIALLPENVYIMLSRYFKVQGGMDSSTSRVPQDGRISLKRHNRDFDLRVSVLPARGGERVVIRFLDQSRKFHLSHNGFALAEIQALRRLARNSSGLVVITGPTGSGKTSTLYALLGELNTADRNIITVENPVEYLLTGVSQVEVQEKSGLTFARILRSVLRQDPDVLLLGEIRDEETAEIAFQAALTGHLVFSTLHTNDAISTVPRLLDLGVRPSILADSLAGVVAQRLCRKLCVACRAAVQAPLATEEHVFHAATRIIPPYRAVGCEACGFTGYRGRIPITEIIEPSGSLREAIFSQDLSRWRDHSGGLNSLGSLASSATRHVISGDTSVKEAARVLGLRYWSALSLEYGAELPEAAYTQVDAEVSQSSGVLYLGPTGAQRDVIVEALESAWFSVFMAATAEEAKQTLEVRDSIVHVVVDIDDTLTRDATLAYVRQARTALAWSRLPALLLLPPSHEGLKEALAADGATSPCLTKPVDGDTVLSHVRMALSAGG